MIVLSGLTPLHFSGHYTDVLPSLNARLSLTDTLILRAAASRVVSRPTLTDLSSAQTITSNPGNERISRGNPDLLPFRASQFELGLESYFNPDSIAAATFFYKSIDSFITRGVSTQLVDQVSFIIDQPVNGKGASVQGRGAELPDGLQQVAGAIRRSGYAGQLHLYRQQCQLRQPGKNGSCALQLARAVEELVHAGRLLREGPVQARVSYTWRDHYLVCAADTDRCAAVQRQAISSSMPVCNIHSTSHIILTADAVNLTNSKEFTYANVIAKYGNLS